MLPVPVRRLVSTSRASWRLLLQLLQEAELRQQSLAAIMLQATPKPKPKPKKVAPRLHRVGLPEMPQEVYVFVFPLFSRPFCDFLTKKNNKPHRRQKNVKHIELC